MKSRTGGFIVLILLLCPTRMSGQETGNWHNLTYLSNMNYWHSRIPVIVENTSAADLSGEPVRLKTGNGPGDLPLTGADATGIRVVDNEGHELLWRLTGPGMTIITKGPVPNACEFILPATIKRGLSETYYIYYDNPSAWPTGATLENKSDAIKHGFITAAENKSAGNALKVKIIESQSITLKEKQIGGEWPEEAGWDIRVPVRVRNFTKEEIAGIPVYVKMDQVFQRLHDRTGPYPAIRMGGKSAYPYFRFANAMILDTSIPAQSELTLYTYFSAKDVKEQQEGYGRWLKDPRNLVKNADITGGEDHWSRLQAANAPTGSELLISNNEGIDGPCMQIHLPMLKEPCELGWSQQISIKPGHTYMFCSMAQCKDILADVSVHVKFQDAKGNSLKKQAGSNRIGGTTGWTYLSGIFKAPDDATACQFVAALSVAGTVFYKGIMMMEVLEGMASSMFFDQKEKTELDGLSAWPVNSIVKVFHEDLQPAKIIPVRITSARNETEPLQLALRSSKTCNYLRVEVTPPRNQDGQQLNDITINKVGYVPIDYPSNYYGTQVPYWYLKYPSEPIGSDGWAGFWPDPLLPAKTFDLPAHSTQPIWIEVSVPEGAAGGDYSSLIRLYQHDSLVKEIPWTVHVWNFTLPQKNTFGATYDIRDAEDISETSQEQFRNKMTREQIRDQYWSFMAKHRMNAGEITPVPEIVTRDGKMTIDFTGYDKAASYYFDELKNPFAYLPTSFFYLFGWAFPPAEKFKEKPYPGEYPYENADRGNLRPEYKQAYQKVLKIFWDHVRGKGWADRYLLYLSDEPHMAENSNADITAQMKALCNMIHEVSWDIPIYVSTWNYRPEWQGYIDVWGVAYNGGEAGSLVPIEDYNLMKKSGDRIWFTTDGNFCTETPYMALERLLPYFGYKYGAEAYEFWGVNWLTFNPYQFGWHSYIFESQAPGEYSWKRYPNGDGYVIYPGKPVGQEGLVASIRLKQVREGAEDYEYLSILGKLIATAKLNGQPAEEAQKALDRALALVNIPCAMGRYSTRILKNPDDVYVAREEVARCIEKLKQ